MFNAALALQAQYCDLHEGQPRDIAIAIKYEGEEECYLFNNESYLHGWKKPDWKIPRGKFILRVTLLYGRNPAVFNFRLVNDGTSIDQVTIRQA